MTPTNYRPFLEDAGKGVSLTKLMESVRGEHLRRNAAGRAVPLHPNRAGGDVPWLSLTNCDAMCDSRRASSSSVLHCGLSLVGHRHALGPSPAMHWQGVRVC